MKVLKKQRVKKDEECECVCMENSILRKLKHPFLSVGINVHVQCQVVCFTMRRICILVFPLGLNSNRVVNITIIEYYYGIYTGHEEGMICFCRLTFAMCIWIVTVYVQSTCTIICYMCACAVYTSTTTREYISTTGCVPLS